MPKSHLAKYGWKHVGDSVINSIGKLQEFTQKYKIDLPQYTIMKFGDDHQPDFKANVIIEYNKQVLKGEGIGKSKQESKENAANQLLTKLDSILDTS